MAMIDVSRVLYNPRFCQDYTVYRQSGYWLAGNWKETETALDFSGPVIPAGPKDLEQVSEGDRVKGIVCFYSAQEIFTTRNEDGNKGTSDQIEWHGKRYRVFQVKPMDDYGYFKAYASRMAGD
jgi:hypothetical protein